MTSRFYSWMDLFRKLNLYLWQSNCLKFGVPWMTGPAHILLPRSFFYSIFSRELAKSSNFKVAPFTPRRRLSLAGSGWHLKWSRAASAFNCVVESEKMELKNPSTFFHVCVLTLSCRQHIQNDCPVEKILGWGIRWGFDFLWRRLNELFQWNA